MSNTSRAPMVTAESPPISRRQLLQGVAGLVVVAVCPAVAVAAPDARSSLEAALRQVFAELGEAERGRRLAPHCARAVLSAVHFRQVYGVQWKERPTSEQTRRLLRRFSSRMEVRQVSAACRIAVCQWDGEGAMICLLPEGWAPAEAERDMVCFLGHLLHSGPDSGLPRVPTPPWGRTDSAERDAWVRVASDRDADASFVAGMFSSAWFGPRSWVREGSSHAA